MSGWILVLLSYDAPRTTSVRLSTGSYGLICFSSMNIPLLFRTILYSVSPSVVTLIVLLSSCQASSARQRCLCLLPLHWEHNTDGGRGIGVLQSNRSSLQPNATSNTDETSRYRYPLVADHSQRSGATPFDVCNYL
ncbi:hypothetical protein GGR50DRAFT_605108 [Xylaria sp. CBS 124048]|nr:hypothetical protein GGR50DRAFT_605108 [Xylaria sp. CBS 124048]